MLKVELRVKEQRLQRGWTQRELANRSGIWESKISYLENHHTPLVNMERLLAVMQAFETTDFNDVLRIGGEENAEQN